MSKNDLKIAFLIAAGAGLQAAENLVPYPLPGLRIGFANIVTLYAINTLGLRAGFAVAVLRPVAAAAAGGWLITPMFFFGFIGSAASFFSMAFLKKLFGGLFSNFGISVAGSMSHVAAQLCLFALFTPPEAVLRLLPVLMGAAVLSGIITGYLVGRVEKADLIPDGLKLSEFGVREIQPLLEIPGKQSCEAGQPLLEIPGKQSCEAGQPLEHARLTLRLALRIAAVAAFTVLLIFVSDTRTVFAVLLITLAAAVAVNSRTLVKAVLGSAPFLVLLILASLWGGEKYLKPLLKLFSFIFFSAALSEKGKGHGMVHGVFRMLKPAEKIGLPVTRFYGILMICLESDWTGLVKTAVARLLAPATK